MKTMRSGLRAALFTAGCAFLCSCILNSPRPLTEWNNCHDSRLEGKWCTESKDEKGAVRQEEVEVSDAGKVYLWKKKGDTDSFFILSKLGESYFISVPVPENQYHILKLRFGDGELELLGLDQESGELAKREIYRTSPDGKLFVRLPRKELQDWCVRNAGKFSARIALYRKQK